MRHTISKSGLLIKLFLLYFFCCYCIGFDWMYLRKRVTHYALCVTNAIEINLPCLHLSLLSCTCCTMYSHNIHSKQPSGSEDGVVTSTDGNFFSSTGRRGGEVTGASDMWTSLRCCLQRGREGWRAVILHRQLWHNDRGEAAAFRRDNGWAAPRIKINLQYDTFRKVKLGEWRPADEHVQVSASLWHNREHVGSCLAARPF